MAQSSKPTQETGTETEPTGLTPGQRVWNYLRSKLKHREQNRYLTLSEIEILFPSNITPPDCLLKED